MIPICFPKIGVNLWGHLQFLKTNRNQALTLCIHSRVTDSGSRHYTSSGCMRS
ncbi:MAG: hypothetical protein P8X79_19015 [Reinekea sp.]